MRVTVKAGPGETLCARCSHGMVTKLKGGRVISRCSRYDRALDRAVEECTGFDKRGTQSLFALQQIAWVIDLTRLKKGDVGFKVTRASELARNERVTLDDEDFPYGQGG